MTLARTLKLFKLPEEPQTPGLRPLTKQDVPQVLPPLPPLASLMEADMVAAEHPILLHPHQQLSAALLMLKLVTLRGGYFCVH